MDSTLAGLIQGCAEALEDNAPRLILADWLDDHGQPERAELVRVQCRLADWVPDWRERQKLIARQDELIAANRDAWLGPVAGLCEAVAFERGLAHLTVAGRDLPRKAFQTAFEDVAGTALVERLRITRTQALRQVSKLDLLERIPSLSLAGLDLQDAAFAYLMDSPHLGRLAVLDLANNRLHNLLWMPESPLARRLARLDLRNNSLSHLSVVALLDARATAGQLRQIDFTGNYDLEEELAPRLAECLPPGHVMNALGMEFVRVPAGSFLMGSPDDELESRGNEKPLHPVTLTQPFWLGRFAVTQGQYERILGDNPSHFTGDDRRPVEQVTWEDAVEFCRLLGELPAEKEAGRTYRLPTEAEWEHACRAGTFTPFHQGGPQSSEMLNYDGRQSYVYGGVLPGPYLRRTAEVGSYPPNAFGLYDMHGNVWEWCRDRYKDNAYPNKAVTNPKGPRGGSARVRRGGCWDAIGSYCRAAHRNGQSPDDRNHYSGFRVVLVGAG
jgi:uncharacterized protein (TIGR02996 family)